MFNENERQEIIERGSNPEEVERQLEAISKGFPAAKLVQAATPDQGIICLDQRSCDELAESYSKEIEQLDIVKFVPASGAASRMFKTLFNFLEWYRGSEADLERYLSDQSFDSPFNFINNVDEFAFFEELKAVMDQAGEPLSDVLMKKRYDRIVHFLLNSSEGLGYGDKPKGLLTFHTYETEKNRVAAAEHLVEGALYTKNNTTPVKIHFTVSPEHETAFKAHLNAILPEMERRYNTTFELTFSNQKKSTDTVATTPDNTPFYTKNGKLLFRPGGHGALIHNLNDLQCDLVFIKNIDNVVPDRLKADTVKYKKALGGLLLRYKEKIDRYCEILSNGLVSESLLKEISSFAKDTLMLEISETGLSQKAIQERLFNLLHRPFRVCGMVRNEGEPGGGPFFVENSQGEISLQIVESSQMNLDNKEQADIVGTATHFNPVDLICALKDYRGEPFNLLKYTDPETGFISSKSLDGRALKALELPGLWNGAMANWITLFVEVPLSTFNPVKVVNDLLRPAHQ